MILLLLSYIVLFVIFIIIAFLIIFYEWKSLDHRYKCRKLPHPKQNIIFGIGLEIVRKKPEEIFNYINDLRKKVGDVMYLEILGIPGVVLFNPEDIERLFSNSQHITKGLEYEVLKPWLCEGLLTSTGSKWNKRRKLLTPTFHFKILESFLPIINNNATVLIDKLISDSVNKELNIESYISLCTLDIICETAMGIKLNAQCGKTSDYVTAIRGVSDICMRRVMTFWMQNNFLFNVSSTGRKFKKQLKKLHQFTMNIIAQKKKSLNLDNNNTERKIRDNRYECDVYNKQHKSFLDCLITIQRDDPSAMTDLAIREEVDTFMFEGQDTTSAALTWTLFLIANHPEVQHNISEELKSIFHNRDVNARIVLQDLNKMQYLEKVIKESLRLYPSVPYLSRSLDTELHLKQYNVPANTNVAVIPYLIHRDPKIYDDPDNFNPERFSLQNSKNRHPYSYIPFSAGYRNCIGQKFAMIEMKVVLSTILRKAKISTAQKMSEVLVKPQTILRPSREIYISFVSHTKLVPTNNI